MRSRARRKLQLYLFDVPYCEGFDLTQASLLERKALLESLLPDRGREAGSGVLQFSDHVVGQGAALLRQACRNALEGVISKRADSPYVAGRGRLWVKSKCTNRQEFVIGGVTEPEGSRQGFGSLLLGYYDDGKLIYSGRVGTGFTEKTLADLSTKLGKLRRASTPFAVPPARSEMKGVRWVEPRLVAEVQFAQWTSDGRLRQPSFEGLREDKEPSEVTRERAKPIATMERPGGSSRTLRRSKPPQGGSIVAGVQLTNPDRVLYPEDKITKIDLARFFDEIADWILPHVTKRPLTLVRCPRGHQQKCFFQKHVNETLPAAIRGVEIREKTGKGRYIVIDDRTGLISLIQLGTLELHPWGCRADDVEHPDRLVFDLDPGPGVRWNSMIEAAGLTRRLLASAGLESFVQTSGGKGLHVVVPLLPKAGWDDAKAFCRAVAHTMQQHDPARYIATMSKSLRKGKIFIDYLRNSRGATSVAPYSTRARPHATVATPLRWDELDSITDAAAFNVKNLRRRLAKMKSDPWNGYFGIDQTLPSPRLNNVTKPAKVTRAGSAQRGN
jgi:bifunctional non-homologous end joining protein LigD